MPAPAEPSARAEVHDGDAEAEAEAEALAELEAIAELEANAAAGDAGIERLRAANDVAALIKLARAYRSGSGAVARDLSRCLACYRAAGSLGSAEAKYSVALFLLAGGVVPQDVKAGAAELRAAADGGSVPAKVYLANLYEQGIGYKADPSKADVWYRSAARAAGVKLEPTAAGYARALADLGSVRHGLEILNDASTTAGDKGLLGRKLKAYGWQLRVRDDAPPPSSVRDPGGARVRDSIDAGPRSAAQSTPGAEEGSRGDAPNVSRTSEPADPAIDPGRGRVRDSVPTAEQAKPVAKKTAKAAALSEDEVADAKPEAAKAKPAKKQARESRFTFRLGVTAFAVIGLFVAIGWSAGYLLAHGARELLSNGPLPVIGDRIELVLPASVALFSLLPGLFVYRFGSVARGVLVAALAGVAGYAAYGAPGGAVLPSLEIQTAAFAVAGYLGTLLVLGVLGGSRLRRPPPPPKMSLGRPIDDE